MKNKNLLDIFQRFCDKNKGEDEYIQACEEILESIEIYTEKSECEINFDIIESFLEPERIIEFKVPWLDDNGKLHINRGFRVQYNSAIGPYKGGLRFHQSVNRSIVKFLGLEQCLKNSLTTLPMGGGKGGSDFDPKGKSNTEIMRFCQSFMNELSKHIGQFTDIPAGDIGVGEREIGYLFGQYKKIKNEYSGVLTGKGITYGGSFARKEATGYGVCYFATRALLTLKKETLKDKIICVSGSGNVALYAIEKAVSMGAKVVTASDSDGWIFDPNGIDINILKQIKEEKKERILKYKEIVPNSFYYSNNTNTKPWSIKCDIAFPCATQNELNIDDAKILVKNGVKAVFEGANMPVTLSAIHYFLDNNVIFGPGKAANAGGVATSGLEMIQNSMRMQWSFDEVDAKLKFIMYSIFDNIYKTICDFNLKNNDLLTGANIAGFDKIYRAMLSQGF